MDIDKKNKDIRGAAYPSADECVNAILDWIYYGDVKKLEAIRERREEIQRKYPKSNPESRGLMPLTDKPILPESWWKKFKRKFKWQKSS